MKKNILIISIYYPPIQSIASNRLYSFAKYLDRDRYRIFVHTIEEEKKFLNDLEDVIISRSRNNTFFKLFSFPRKTNKMVHYSKVIYNIVLKRLSTNIYESWIDKSYELLRVKIKKENIELILSSFSPDASHMLALRLKKEFPNLIWIADMRDEMSCSPYIDAATKVHYEELEQQIFKYANALTSVSRPILNEFQDMCTNKKVLFAEIRNGYDFLLEEKEIHNDIFTLTYTGNFYGEINPNNFFKALESFIKKNIGVKLRVQLVGVKTHFDIPSILMDMVEVVPPVAHEEAIEIMKKSDVLLAIHRSSGRKGLFSGKLFEYLAALKPILGLMDENDVAAKLIKECNAGYVCDSFNIDNIEKNIALLYAEYINKEVRIFNLKLIEKHHRSMQVKRLEKLIEELING